MGRRDNREIHETGDLITHRVPSKRSLNLSRSEYQPFGAFYSHLRHWRRTWLPESRQPPISRLLAQVETLADNAKTIPVSEDLRPVVESMLNLAPALVDHSNGWRRFETEIQQIRERFERDGPSPRLFADNSPGRSSFLTRLHSIRKAFRSENPIERDLLALLFTFARAVGARAKWKTGLNEWVRGVRGARDFELDSFAWGHRDCLIEARYQMIVLGRSLIAENSNATFNRTKIRNRASIIHAAAHAKEPITLESLKRQVQEAREINWEAYLNKLPGPLFPKKDGA